MTFKSCHRFFGNSCDTNTHPSWLNSKANFVCLYKHQSLRNLGKGLKRTLYRDRCRWVYRCLYILSHPFICPYMQIYETFIAILASIPKPLLEVLLYWIWCYTNRPLHVWHRRWVRNLWWGVQMRSWAWHVNQNKLLAGSQSLLWACRHFSRPRGLIHK